jgi:hypothetical protein
VNAVGQAIALAREVPETNVHTLVDAEAIQQLPSLPVMGREIRRLFAESPNRSTSTIFGVSRMVRFMLEMLMKITPLRMKVFDTRQDALDFIVQMVATEQQVGRTVGEDAE